jgi:hypothetical protein
VFAFRIILHVDEQGQARLLNQIIEMWDSVAGEAVLFTDDALIGRYSGVSLRNGQPVGRRISAPAFGTLYEDDAPGETKTLAGTFGESLTATLVLPRDDPTNPFYHRYHPDHGLTEDLDPDEQYDITREVSLTFDGADADGDPLPDTQALAWGSATFGGEYREAIDGLQSAVRNPIRIRGSFTLRKASSVEALTTAQP